MTLHILRLSPESRISCCATSGSLTQHGDNNNKIHLLLEENVETTSPERYKGLNRVGQAFLNAIWSDQTEVVLIIGRILVVLKPLGKGLQIWMSARESPATVGFEGTPQADVL